MINITVEQAQAIWDDRSNGRCDGMSSGKGGRAWLEGEFQLCELEALCVLLRAHAGDWAEGAEELIRNREPVEDHHEEIDLYSREEESRGWRGDADSFGPLDGKFE